jgi:hypothetical protein
MLGLLVPQDLQKKHEEWLIPKMFLLAEDNVSNLHHETTDIPRA